MLRRIRMPRRVGYEGIFHDLSTGSGVWTLLISDLNSWYLVWSDFVPYDSDQGDVGDLGAWSVLSWKMGWYPYGDIYISGA